MTARHLRHFVCRLQGPVRAVGHCSQIRQTGRDSGAEMQPHGGRKPTLQGPVDQERRQIVPVH